MLSNLLKRNRIVLLGLNSGTSIDSLDLAAVEITRRGSKSNIKFIGGFTRKFPKNLRDGLVAMAESDSCVLEKLIELDNQLGRFCGKVAGEVAQKLKNTGHIVRLVGSHGQTIRHYPADAKNKNRGSLQIGSPAHIASATLLPVASDFRQADIALGNEGAPITVAAMREIFQDKKESRLIVNIGGMSNFFYFSKSGKQIETLAHDCGPGNIISDLLISGFRGDKFDKGGKLASQGTVSKRLLTVLLASPFFVSQKQSTGREEFGTALVNKIVEFGKKFKLSQEDLMATAVELTAIAISKTLVPIIKQSDNITSLYLTGGGRKNKFMVKRISHHLPDLTVRDIDCLGMSGDYVEATSYAVMAEMTLRGLASATQFGVKTKQSLMPVLGVISLPPKRIK